MGLALTNLRLLDPASGLDELCDTGGGVLIEGDKISELGVSIFANGLSENIRAIDCGGLCVAPGLVDMRVHLREPGAEHKEDISGLVATAAKSGVTTLGVLPNTDPVVDDISVVDFVHRKSFSAGGAAIRCFGAATKGAAGEAMSEIGLLTQAGAVGFTDGIRPIANAAQFSTLLRYGAIFNAIIVQQPFEPDLAGDGVMNAGELATELGLKGIPAHAESVMLARDLMILESVGGRYHASLISTGASVDLIREAKAKGLDVTCDTAPPYFVLNETAVGSYRTFAKLMPPLRNEADRIAVRAALIDGTIDLIVSDHAAQDAETKRLPFAQAEPGGVGLETLLPLSLELMKDKGLDLCGALSKVTAAPSERFGLDRGTLAKGSIADLVVFDPDAEVAISTENLLSKSKNTPFDGRMTHGQVSMTVIGGKVWATEGDGGDDRAVYPAGGSA
jgi:dihydroorotase